MSDSFNGIVIEDARTVDQVLELPNLRVTGNCFFMDTVEAERLEIDGEAKFSGFVTCDRLWVSGSAYMMHTLLTETLQIAGTLSVLGRCISDVFVLKGTGIFHSTFSAGRLLVKPSGTLETTGRVKGDRVTIQGQMTATSRLSCREAEFISCFPSEIHEICADVLRVKYQVPPGQLELGCSSYLLSASFLDVSEAVLEYTYAEQLFCDTAVIGKGCRIREVIYRDGIEIQDGAIVERLSKA